MITCRECKKIGKQCGNCKEYHRKYQAKHRKEMNAYSAKYYADNRDWIRAKFVEKRASDKKAYKKVQYGAALKRKYSITHTDYELLLTSQNNKCGICSKEFNDKFLPCIDHDHKTGKVRNLLCRKCNLFLWALENEEFFTLASQYLNKWMK